MTYQIDALPLAPFAPLFALSEEALLALGGRRMIADSPHSAPCRVSLVDAAPGERLILISHRHLDAPASPYHAEGAVFVREAAVEPGPVIGTVPDLLGRRLLSVRAYDTDGMMTDADVVEGRVLDARLRLWLDNPVVAQVQLHTARRGCYLARAVRPD
ncbi:DUF1203 domain-containing protein [Brevundimonas sp.]|uniref:DUF1203 domain-containing protein n=1 Tax=Brevundimonas sp. TaxID=1871086 RepID=UPI00248A7330|nr:DUF1203 domain-containing protein [Brevundimonas sp.]MDI1279967.1 DUF1203 domain-containing protein [Brevundimonas sp.]